MMQNELDVDVAVPLMQKAKKNFPEIYSASFDKGFWSPSNKDELNNDFAAVALPKKGKLSKADKEHQYSEEFIEAQKGHSAVEAAISAYDNHGLDKCPDHGIDAFKRYTSLAVLARNIQHLGATLKDQKRRSELHSAAIKKGLEAKKSA